jgi:sugar lactone lactonase YvrE
MATRVAEGKAQGLRGLLFDRVDTDRLVAPTSNGTLLAVSISTEIVHEYAYISTNPLTSCGQKSNGDIIVADAGKGLVKVEGGTATRTTLLTNAVGLDCSPINTVVDLDIDSEGCVYFSDNDGLNGRLLKHDPSSGQTTVLLQNLSFATGVCLDHTDGMYVLVVESLKCRIIRHWLKGADAGTHDLFSGQLPGLPGTISPSAHFNGFWVAIKALPSAQRNGPTAWAGGIENLNKYIFGGGSPIAQKTGEPCIMCSTWRVAAEVQ